MAMNVSGSMGADSAAGMQPLSPQGTDAASRAIQKQIQNKQQELQKISENPNLSPEEKAKKRQAIQQEISNLNLQLRQHQMELRKAKQNKESSTDNLSGNTPKGTTKSQKEQRAGLSQAGMEAMISADSALNQAEVQGRVATNMEGNARVLKSELRQEDGTRSRAAKEEALAQTEQTARDAAASQMKSLGDAKAEMEKAGTPEDKSREPEQDKDDKEKDDRENNTGMQAEEDSTAAPDHYVSVNVLL